MVAFHPSAALRSEYQRGTASPGAALAIMAHAALCTECARALGEARLVRPDMAALAGDTRNASCARLPGALGAVQLGAWRRGVGGVSNAPVERVSGLGEASYLLRVRPKCHIDLPPAAELLLVVKGELTAARNVYRTGDFLQGLSSNIGGEATATDEGCLCLIVGDDRLQDSFSNGP